MRGNSSPVHSEQTDLFSEWKERSDLLLKNYKSYLENYKKSLDLEEVGSRFSSVPKNKRLIVDHGCGAGDSLLELSSVHKDSVIVGIESSPVRYRKALEKVKNHHSIILLQGSTEEFLIHALHHKLNVEKQYFFYPNPWPKEKLYHRRWHGHALFPGIFMISPKSELRTNWKIYALEFQTVVEYMFQKKNMVEEITPSQSWNSPVSEFEKKYRESGQTIWRIAYE